MNLEPLDPQRERMIAALYGELDPDEERALRALLAEDDALRAEWEELSAARAFLGRAEVCEPAPSFAFLEAPPAQSAARVGTERAGATGRGRGWSRRLWHSPLPGFAAAAAALAILLLAGLRADRQDGALVLRFGPAPAPETMTAALAPLASPGGEVLEPGMHVRAGATGSQAPLREDGVTPRGADAGPGAGTDLSAAELGGYLTRVEFVAYAREMTDLMRGLVGSEEDRRRAELAYVVRALYDQVSQRREADYQQLNGQIQQVWMGLAGLGARDAERSRSSLELEPEAHGTRPVQHSLDPGR